MSGTTTPSKKRPAAFCKVASCCKAGEVHDRGNSRDRANLQARMESLHGTVCVYCQRPGTERDRIVESCYYHAINLLPACKACNNARNATGGVTLTAEQRARVAAGIRKNTEAFGSNKRSAPADAGFRAALAAALAAVEG